MYFGRLLTLSSQEEQQRLRGKINEADEMIKSLDDCIHELKTGMAICYHKMYIL